MEEITGEDPKLLPAGTPVKEVSAGPFALNLRDFGKGLLTSVCSAAVVAAQQAFTSPDFFSMNTLKIVGLADLGGGLGYLGRKFFDGAQYVVPVETKK